MIKLSKIVLDFDPENTFVEHRNALGIDPEKIQDDFYGMIFKNLINPPAVALFEQFIQASLQTVHKVH